MKPDSKNEEEEQDKIADYLVDYLSRLKRWQIIDPPKWYS